MDNMKKLNSRKLGATWERPYIFDEVVGKGAYILKNSNGKMILRTWNTLNLKKHDVR